MLIKDLKPNQPVDQLELLLKEKAEARDFTSKYGKAGRVCNAVGQDETGETIHGAHRSSLTLTCSPSRPAASSSANTSRE